VPKTVRPSETWTSPGVVWS